jgi:sulfatase maturation enzyme AslB (radical SAM superfamily)
MTFEKTFCSSPWMHMRITNSGTYEPCRWMNKSNGRTIDFNNGIQTTSPLTYFQQSMSGIRKELLDGNALDMCKDCHKMDLYDKPSGRLRQLLKVGVQDKYFEKSLASSTLKESFDYSAAEQGHTNRSVIDWQIDLGNFCNSACVFCEPNSSSRIAAEFVQLGLVNKMPPPSWCDDPALLDKFINDLLASSELSYLHFLGGETTITPGFKKILAALIDAGIAKDIVIGFTTNLTVWPEAVIALLIQFKQVHLGMSIETLTKINDYVRYPSRTELVTACLDQWVALGREHNWLLQLRITPTCLTVHDLTTIYDYAWENSIAVESCNFLDKPAHMRISVLPQEHRAAVIDKLTNWIETHPVDITEKIINTRSPSLVLSQIVQDATSYLNFLTNVLDESSRLPDLVHFLKMLESNRKNSILTYLPQYEQLFRSAGY